MLITLPTGFLADLVGAAGTTMTGLWPVLAVIGGIVLGFYILNRVLSIVTSRVRGGGRT